MKKLFLFAAFTLLAVNCFSQDYIYLKTGEVLEVTILEEGAVTVRYRIFDDTSKKMYFAEKSDIVKLVFQDGREVTYNQTKSQDRSQNQNDYEQNQNTGNYGNNRNRNNYDYNRRNSDNNESRRQPEATVRQNDPPEVKNAPFSQIHAAVVLPQGDFEEGVAMGFNLGYKRYTPLSASNLSLVFGLDGFYNGLDSESKDVMDLLFSKLIPGVSIDTYPVFLNFSATGGINYTHFVSDKLNIYGEVVAGVNFSTMTNLTLSAGSESAKVTFGSGFGFCYGLGGGIQIDNKYSIGLRYNDLSSYKYKMKLKAGGDSVNMDKFEVPAITSLTIALGILF